MARRKHCGHKSHLTAIGSSITFIGALKNEKYALLRQALQYPLHIVEKGNDLVAYFRDDWYKDELEYLYRIWGKALGTILLSKNIKKNPKVELINVLPERLPLRDNRTWEEVYEEGLESTECDDSGSSYKSRKTGANYVKQDEEEPAIVQVYSINEYRTNGHF